MSSQAIRLGDVLLGIETGKSFQTSETPARADELGVLKVSALTWSEFRPEEAKAVVNYEPEDNHRVRAGDLLISRANTRELVGAVVLVEKDYPYRLLSDKTLRLIIDAKKADKSFLLYALRSSASRTHIENFATGSSDSMRNISQAVISSIPIKLPGLRLQRQISSLVNTQLAAAADARQAARTQAAEADALIDAVYRQAFENIVPVAVPPEFEDAPTGWRWMKLGELAQLESGHTPRAAAATPIALPEQK